MNYQLSGVEALLDRTSRNIQSGIAGSASSELEKHWFGPTAEKIRDISRNRITDAILKLRERRENWDGYGSAVAQTESLQQAIDTVERFISTVSALRLNWLDPHVGLDECGYVLLEWWVGDKRLTVYFCPNDHEFVSSWGTNIESQMDTGRLTDETFVKQWRWLSLLDA
jgi:hypothetical protein